MMSDQNLTQPARILKIGATRIVADASMAALDPEQIRTLLKLSYPEVTNATVRETTLEDGTQVLEFLSQPGRKG